VYLINYVGKLTPSMSLIQIKICEEGKITFEKEILTLKVFPLFEKR
jgi:hypothetical protein